MTFAATRCISQTVSASKCSASSDPLAGGQGLTPQEPLPRCRPLCLRSAPQIPGYAGDSVHLHSFHKLLEITVYVIASSAAIAIKSR